MKKRILLLSDFFPPETISGANRLESMARILSNDYDVYVATLKPSKPSPAHYTTLSLEHHDSQLPYNVRRTIAFHPSKGKFLLRALREHMMALVLGGHALSIPADIVVTSLPSMFLSPVGLVLAKIKRAKFVLDVRDITWNYAREVTNPSRMMKLGLWALEKYMILVVRQADLVAGVTPGITKLLVESGVSPEMAITVPNAISGDLLTIGSPANDRIPDQTRPKVTYAGTIGYNQDVGILLDVAYALPEVDFFFAGDGPELPLLKQKASKLGAQNVHFLGYLSREELLKVYAESDVLFAKVRSTPTLNATAVPTKLFEYMATGKPLVYAGKGLAAEFLEKIGCALTVASEDLEAITAAIQELLSDARLRDTLGGKGRDFVRRNYHRDELMEGLARELRTRFG
jgi:colanic acid biosynthesis glycosyl transferase WcaI